MKNETTDIQIADALRRGEPTAYIAAMNRYGHLVMSVLEPMLCDGRDVEEALQDVFAKAFESIKRYDATKSSIATWLARIARNCAIDRLRERGRRLTIADETEILDRADEDEEEPEIDDLIQAIKQLRAEERLLLNLIYYDGMSPAEAAEVLDLTPAVVSSRLYRIKQKLKSLINENNG